MPVNVGHLFRKRTVRNLRGEIIDLVDQTDGSQGVIISKGRVINQEKINEMAKKELDRQTAAQAVTVQVESSHAEERTAPPSKIEELEKRLNGQDDKLDAILKLLQK